MLNFNEIKIGRVLNINDEPFLIIKTIIIKWRAVDRLKSKDENLINGNVLENLSRK